MKMEDAPEGTNVVPGVIRDIVYLGSETNYEIETRRRAAREDFPLQSDALRSGRFYLG